MKIYEAAELLRGNKISPTELTKSVLEKIKTEDENIKSYITVCENALDMAKAAEENKNTSPLWGIPLAVKDNICTKGVLTTAGSRMLENFIPPYNATVVERLIESGAVIAGKTNMDEFGMGSEGKYSAFAQTSNPVNLAYVPGGSSGGSCAAVKAELALGALGTDTGGSIRQPAAFCGTFGLKPTNSLVSRYGLIAFASSLDCIGPVCMSAKDVAIMLDCIAGSDEKDATCSKRAKESYYNNIKADVKNLRIGIPVEFFEHAQADVKHAVLNAVKKFEEMGAYVEECSLPGVKYAVSTYYIISSSEASSNLARYDTVRFGKRHEGYESLDDMYVQGRSEAFGDEVKRRILLGTYMLSGGAYDLYYLKAKRAREIIREEFDKLFEKYDIIVTPVCNVGVWKKGEGGKVSDAYKNDVCTAVVSLAMLPAISVPCGMDKNNMPVGMQIIGKKFAEQTLLNTALAYEEGGFYDGV